MMSCDVMWCDVYVMWRGVMWFDARRCDAMWCDAMWCDDDDEKNIRSFPKNENLNTHIFGSCWTPDSSPLATLMLLSMSVALEAGQPRNWEPRIVQWNNDLSVHRLVARFARAEKCFNTKVIGALRAQRNPFLFLTFSFLNTCVSVFY